MKHLLTADSRRSRLLVAAAIYLVVTCVFFLVAPYDRLVTHTPYNHFALLAEAWLHGHLDLGGAPPSYAGGNDFAYFHGKWFVSFPPFPAVLLVPWVALAGSAQNVRDGQAFLWLAGIGPGVLWLALEKLRRLGDSERSPWENLVLALLFAFGTVYWFTAEQGTVWFAAHVVSVGLASLFLLFTIRAERPLLAGVVLGLAWLTRPSMAMMGLLFLFEAWRAGTEARVQQRDLPSSWARKVHAAWTSANKRRILSTVAMFLVPVTLALAFSAWHNHARFGDPTEFGHRLLTVAWKGRISRWGLFSYHYLARNLGVMLTSLPYLQRVPSGLQINGHGLALWLTTPLYLWIFWPKQSSPLYKAVATTAASIALVDLLYQNSGWVQFGYRFSNDYALLLFILLAIGHRPFGKLFWSAALFSIGINAFGAITFDRQPYRAFYFIDSSQRILYQPD